MFYEHCFIVLRNFVWQSKKSLWQVLFLNLFVLGCFLSSLLPFLPSSLSLFLFLSSLFLSFLFLRGESRCGFTFFPLLILWFKNLVQMCLGVGSSWLMSPGTWSSTFDLDEHLHSFIHSIMFIHSFYLGSIFKWLWLFFFLTQRRDTTQPDQKSHTTAISTTPSRAISVTRPPGLRHTMPPAPSRAESLSYYISGSGAFPLVPPFL